MRTNGGRAPCGGPSNVIVMLALVAVGLVDLSVESGLLRTTLEAAATLTGFGLVRIWLRSNRIALDLQPRPLVPPPRRTPGQGAPATPQRQNGRLRARIIGAARAAPTRRMGRDHP